jgi:hypothetical protein
MAAVAFLIVMLGISFLFPDMLKGGPNETISTMRVAVYMIVCVFIFLAVKIGWSTKSFQDFEIKSGWVSIIIAALGGKAVQSLAENNVYAKRSAKDGDTKSPDTTKQQEGNTIKK